MYNLSIKQLSEKINGKFKGTNCHFNKISIDTRTIKKGDIFVAILGEMFDGHNFIEEAITKGASAVIVQKEISHDIPTIQVENTLHALGQIAALHRSNFNIPVVAITGSCGKTTTKNMLVSIVEQKFKVLTPKKNFNNEIGVPLTLLELDDTHDCIILEMGACRIGDIEYLCKIAKPDVSLVTCIEPCHSEKFGSIENIFIAKSEIFENVSVKGIRIINSDDEYYPKWQKNYEGKKQITFGCNHKASINCLYQTPTKIGSNITVSTDVGDVSIQLFVPGTHNVQNALAAIACARAINCNLEEIKTGLEKFQGVASRLQTVLGSSGECIIDDTYNANPSATIAALKVLARFPAPRWFVFGDMLELGEGEVEYHKQIGEEALKLGVKRLYTFGKLSYHATQTFGSNAKHFESQEELINTIVRDTNEEVTILIKGSRSMKMENVVQALTKPVTV